MAIINTLRNKMGKFVVFAIGFSIVAFVMADLLGPNSMIMGGGQTNVVGEIAGEEIDYQVYSQEVEDLKQRYGNPGEGQMAFVRNAAWDALISKIAFGKEFNELGLAVTPDELIDMVQGRNIDPGLRQQFTNPATGQYDVDQVLAILAQYSNLPPEQQMQWINFENNLKQGRLRVKYDNLLAATNYVTNAEAKAYYAEQTEIAEIRYLYVPYYSISDSAATVTDAQLQQYLSEHEEEYKIEESKTINFVNFEILPSGADSAQFDEEMEALKTQFASQNNDSLFAMRYSYGQGNFFNKYNYGNLPSLLSINANTLQENEIYGPYYESGVYRLYKVSEIFEDTVYQAKVKHILFQPTDTSSVDEKNKAKAEARRILREIKNGADFAAMAAEHGDDGTAARGGDLGWGTEGASWVPKFEEPVFARTTPGLLNDVVETQFGYHIIEVVEAKTNKAFKIASIDSELTPSQETVDEVYRKADQFAYNSGNADEFTANATEAGLEIQTAADVEKNASNLPGVTDNARRVVQWMYREASIGEVSKAEELGLNIVVALLVSEKEEGVASLEDVRNEITLKVRNQQKAAIIKDKLAGLTGSLDEMATAYGTDASVHASSDLKLSSNSLPAVGFAPNVVGVSFALDPGSRSSAIETDNGIVIVELVNKTGAPEIADYTTYKNQIDQANRSRVSINAMEAIKKFANIEDNRYKFY